MAKVQEKQAFLSNTSAIKEKEEKEAIYIDVKSEAVSPTGCGCFRLCFQWGRKRDGETRSLLQQNGDGEHKETWLVKKLKEVREVSEIIAGPKWKNLIRKIGKYCKPRRARTHCDQYDPKSYALNFDHGLDEQAVL
ncbi:unnamed protein product [Ilex paraguariensis]|uniref:Uncharacterized protein n=1 Tax=Ilex paraguariensis TaxID=185542 RepID=A0ABC8QRD1_9AQUA